MREPHSSSPRTYDEVIGGRLRDNRHKLNKERFKLENLFHREDSQALEQVIQRLCILILGRLNKTSSNLI